MMVMMMRIIIHPCAADSPLVLRRSPREKRQAAPKDYTQVMNPIKNQVEFIVGNQCRGECSKANKAPVLKELKSHKGKYFIDRGSIGSRLSERGLSEDNRY